MVDLAAAVQKSSVTDAIIRFYRDWWLARCGSIVGFLDCLFVMEFRSAGCDIAELFEAFVDANETLERRAYAQGRQRHFGIAYLARSPLVETGLIRALLVVEPQAEDCFMQEASAHSERRIGLKVAKCDNDPADPDAQWRWLENGIQASTTMFEGAEPVFALLGDPDNRTANVRGVKSWLGRSDHCRAKLWRGLGPF